MAAEAPSAVAEAPKKNTVVVKVFGAILIFRMSIFVLFAESQGCPPETLFSIDPGHDDNTRWA
jgi:hypothetical protein